MKVLNVLNTRGCNDILIAVTDGLKGMPEVLNAIYRCCLPKNIIDTKLQIDLGQFAFFANPRYVSITFWSCASCEAGPSRTISPVSST